MYFSKYQDRIVESRRNVQKSGENKSMGYLPHFFSSLYISLSLSIYIYLYLSHFISLISLSLYIYIYISISFCIFLSIYLSIYLCTFLSLSISIYLSVSLCIYLIYLYFWRKLNIRGGAAPSYQFTICQQITF